MFNKKPSFYAILIVSFLSLPLLSQSKAPLGTKEIQSSKKIQFQNKSLKKATAEIIQENTDKGKKLSEQITKNPTAVSEIDGFSITRVLPGKDNKFGADILNISEDQSFDHINSIARILASYIERSFQYSEANSETLALYVLYYNAAHRKDAGFFNKKYTSELNSKLDKNKIGIDTSYRNWPGKTQIVIPIVSNILKDSGSDVTTDELEDEVGNLVKKEKDPETKEKMNSEKDKMDQLQKNKLTEEKKQVAVKKDELAKKEQDLKNQENANKQALSKAEADLQELKKDPIKNAAKIEEKQKEVTKVQEAQKKVEEEKKKVADTKEQLDKKEESLAKKEESKSSGNTTSSSSTSSTASTEKPTSNTTAKEEVAAVKEELAKVKEELQKKEEKSENVIGDRIIFMKFIKYDADGHYSNELWAIDPVKDDALFKSPYTNVCSKEFVEVKNQGILVLGYEGDKVDDRKHKLILLDTKTLKVIKQSDTSDVFWRTPMIYTEDKIHVIEKFEGNYHLSRFKPDLALDVRSSDPVEENSEITFFKDKIYVTGKGKGSAKTTIKVFKRADLTLIKTITPN
ncbi:MAG: hypothetical protein CK427_09280 [Leptospira sp.]|nr:MAG: hypothetical protein CK427_09280 [Leptospira sp.]